jgi:hypothetical protein
MGEKLVRSPLEINMSDLEKRNSSAHFVGASHEHYVAAAFLKNGCPVYWPAIQQESVDFIVQNCNGLERVQVKSATWCKNKHQKYRYLQCRTQSTKKYKHIPITKLYDILAIVAGDGRIWLIPAEEVNSSNISLDGDGPNHKNRDKWRKYLWTHLTFGATNEYLQDMKKQEAH